MLNERQGLVIWVRNLRNVKTLRKYGNLHYVSKKMKYAVIYCNKSDIERISEKISALGFVKSVEPSLRCTLKTEFDGHIVERDTNDLFNII